MATRKPKAKTQAKTQADAKPDAGTNVHDMSISNCVFNNAAGANANTTEAIKALAEASSRHADALIAMAQSLRGTQAHVGASILLGGDAHA